MKPVHNARLGTLLAISFAFVAALSWPASVAADPSIRGVITERGDSTITVQMKDYTQLVVVLSDEVKFGKGAASALVPGLWVTVTGSYDAQNRMVARKITYTKAALKDADAIQAGVTPTAKLAKANSEALQAHGLQIQSSNQVIQRHGAAIDQQGQQIAAGEHTLAAAIATANSRFANLDDYKVVNTLTVYFENNKATLSSSDKAKLQQLAADAQAIDAYVITVKGYASAVGPASVNEALSSDRADAVRSFLLQNTSVPLTKMFAPAAMGISEQVASNQTKEGQAENRRAVVTLLQNRGVANQPATQASER